MSLNTYEVSAGVFIRGLGNLKAQLTKAESQLAGDEGGEAALLAARLAADAHDSGASYAPTDLHWYTFAAHVQWAAEGARLAIGHLLGAPPVPDTIVAESLADLHRRLDATMAYLRDVAPGDLEAGFERTIVIEHRRGSTRASGGRFLLAFAIPHFFYHVTTAYGILRNQGLQLTMGDFMGDWVAS